MQAEGAANRITNPLRWGRWSGRQEFTPPPKKGRVERSPPLKDSNTKLPLWRQGLQGSGREYIGTSLRESVWGVNARDRPKLAGGKTARGQRSGMVRGPTFEENSLYCFKKKERLL